MDELLDCLEKSHSDLVYRHKQAERSLKKHLLGGESGDRIHGAIREILAQGG